MSGTGDILRRVDDSGIPVLLVRLLLGGIMIWYAVPKIADPADFLVEVRNYEIMPERPPVFINSVAVILPWVELIGSIALILGVSRRGAAALFAGLLAFFTVAIMYRTWGIYSAGETPLCDIKFDCGCGHGEVLICPKVAANVGLILMAVYLMFSRSGRFSLSSFWNGLRASKESLRMDPDELVQERTG